MSHTDVTAMTIGAGVVVRLASPLHVPGNIELEGEIEGDVTCEGIHIGLKGRISGSLTAENADVEGEIVNHLTAETLTLRESSRAGGSVEYGSISIEAGAQIDATLSKRQQKEVDVNLKIDEVADG
jgi:cytoskeletal protein CcmA (bactofilin family)